jgi:hypothetical protein
MSVETTFAPPSPDSFNTFVPVYGHQAGPGGFDPATMFVIVGILAAIGFVVHLAMASMVMREARAAGENPMAWGILAFSRPFVGYALWRSQARDRERRGPTPMMGFGTGPGPQRPDVDPGFGMTMGQPGWPRDPDDPPGLGNPGAPV